MTSHFPHTLIPLPHATDGLCCAAFTVNFIQENTYLLWDSTGEAVIVDCGAFLDEERQGIANFIEQKGLRPVHLLNTHGHFDHIFGNAYMAEHFSLAPEMCRAEVTTYESACQQMTMFLHRELPLEIPAPGRLLDEGDTIRFGTHTLSVIHTPGHTPGGICFYCATDGLLLSGDSLFRREIGRCDLPGGNEFALIDSLRRKVMPLPPDVIVLPGHGPSTTVGEEATENHYAHL